MTERLLILMLAAMLFLSIIYVGGVEREISSKLLGAAIVGFSYVTGILAVLFNAALLFIGFILSLPVVSNIYSFVNMLLSKIFGVLIKSTLRRFEWYRNLELRVKNSKIYLRIATKGTPRKIKFLSVAECKSCKKEIPSDGKFCPYCGSKVASPAS